MKELIIVSGNSGKIKEAQEILTNFKIISIKDLDIKTEIKEDKKTLRQWQGKQCSDAKCKYRQR